LGCNPTRRNRIHKRLVIVVVACLLVYFKSPNAKAMFFLFILQGTLLEPIDLESFVFRQFSFSDKRKGADSLFNA
jgi:hypothetical protein